MCFFYRNWQHNHIQPLCLHLNTFCWMNNQCDICGENKQLKRLKMEKKKKKKTTRLHLTLCCFSPLNPPYNKYKSQISSFSLWTKSNLNLLPSRSRTASTRLWSCEEPQHYRQRRSPRASQMSLFHVHCAVINTTALLSLRTALQRYAICANPY